MDEFHAELGRMKDSCTRQAHDLIRKIEEINRLREVNAELLAALQFIVNDAEPGEDAQLTVTGYNKACAAIAKAKREA